MFRGSFTYLSVPLDRFLTLLDGAATQTHACRHWLDVLVYLVSLPDGRAEPRQRDASS